MTEEPRKPKTIVYIAILASFLIFIALAPVIQSAITTNKAPANMPPWMVGVSISLMPIAAFTVVFVAMKGVRHSKKFSIMIGLLLAALAWEFLADPWSIEWRLYTMPDAGMQPIILYASIGTVFILLATFFFKRGLEA